MNKLLLFVVCLVAVTSLYSCRDEMKFTSVKIDTMTDTTFIAKIDERNITFNIKNTTYDNGLVMPGDSVVVYYVGELRKGEVTAALVKLLPRKGHVVDAVYDQSKELKTAPMTEEEQKAFNEGIEYAKEHKK